MNEMLKDLVEYREKIKKQLDEVENKINSVLVEGNFEKALELSEVMEGTLDYYRVIEKEIKKVEKIFEVR